MDIKDYIKKVRKKIDLEENDIEVVLLYIDDYCIEIINHILDISEELVEKERDYKKEKKKRLEHFRNADDEDIFSQLKTKEDRELLMYSTDILDDLKDEIDNKKRDIRFLEDLKKQIREIKSTINTYIEYRRFMNGQ